MADVSGTGSPRFTASVLPRAVGRWVRDRSTTSRRGQDGFSLVEALVALVLTSGLVMTLVAGLLFLVRTTESNAEVQSLQLTAASYAEHLKALPYGPCSTAAAYQSAPGFALTNGTSVSIESVEYWQLQGPAGGAGGWTDECVVGADAGAQRLTLVAEFDGREHRLQMVKTNR